MIISDIKKYYRALKKDFKKQEDKKAQWVSSGKPGEYKISQEDLKVHRYYFGRLRESQAQFLYIAALAAYSQETTKMEILSDGPYANTPESLEKVVETQKYYEKLFLAQHLRMHLYQYWKEERYNHEDSLGTPFM